MKVTVVMVLLAGVLLSARAENVNLTLYNSAPLLDSDGATVLAGTPSGGDLVQLVLAGANGTIDTPLASGLPGGDDVILSALHNPTHVGTGMTATNTGIFVQVNLRFNDSHAGANAYVRFWNDATAAGATHYGNSQLFALAGGDAFGEAEADVAESPSDPRTTGSAFNGGSPRGTLFKFAMNRINRRSDV